MTNTNNGCACTPNQSIKCTVTNCAHHCQDQNYCGLKDVYKRQLYHMDPSRTISLPAIYSVKKSSTDKPHLNWLVAISPEHDPERLSLAKMCIRDRS